MRDDVYSLEDELQDKVEELMSAKSSIQTFEKGKYSEDIRLCCYDLLSLNVGIRNVVPIIKSVMKNLAHQSVDRLPSNTARC